MSVTLRQRDAIASSIARQLHRIRHGTTREEFGGTITAMKELARSSWRLARTIERLEGR